MQPFPFNKICIYHTVLYGDGELQSKITRRGEEEVLRQVRIAETAGEKLPIQEMTSSLKFAISQFVFCGCTQKPERNLGGDFDIFFFI